MENCRYNLRPRENIGITHVFGVKSFKSTRKKSISEAGLVKKSICGTLCQHLGNGKRIHERNCEANVRPISSRKAKRKSKSASVSLLKKGREPLLLNRVEARLLTYYDIISVASQSTSPGSRKHKNVNIKNYFLGKKDGGGICSLLSHLDTTNVREIGSQTADGSQNEPSRHRVEWSYCHDCRSVRRVVGEQGNETPLSNLSRHNLSEITTTDRSSANDSVISSDSIVTLSDDEESDECMVITRTTVPIVLRRISNIVITLGNIAQDKAQMVWNLGKNINGISLDFRITPRTTHLVLENPSPNSIKYLLGIAMRIFVLSDKWIDQCLLEGRLVTEEKFLAGDLGPRRCVNPLLEPPFIGTTVCLEGTKCLQLASDIERLCTLCGAEIMRKRRLISDNAGIRWPKPRLFLYHTNFMPSTNQLNSLSEDMFVPIEVHWVFACVAAFKVVPITPYLIPAMQSKTIDDRFGLPMGWHVPVTETG